MKVRSRDVNKAVETYALLDSGSDISLCDKTLVRELGVRGQEKTFFLTTQEREDSPRVGHEISLTVEPLDGTDKVEVKRLWTVDRLNASRRSIPSEQDTRRWPHLEDIKYKRETSPINRRHQRARGLLESSSKRTFGEALRDIQKTAARETNSWRVDEIP